MDENPILEDVTKFRTAMRDKIDEWEKKVFSAVTETKETAVKQPDVIPKKRSKPTTEEEKSQKQAKTEPKKPTKEEEKPLKHPKTEPKQPKTEKEKPQKPLKTESKKPITEEKKPQKQYKTPKIEQKNVQNCPNSEEDLLGLFESETDSEAEINKFKELVSSEEDYSEMPFNTDTLGNLFSDLNTASQSRSSELISQLDTLIENNSYRQIGPVLNKSNARQVLKKHKAHSVLNIWENEDKLLKVSDKIKKTFKDSLGSIKRTVQEAKESEKHSKYGVNSCLEALEEVRDLLKKHSLQSEIEDLIEQFKSYES